jgi:hydrogenase nickel incorporation protein HypB
MTKKEILVLEDLLGSNKKIAADIRNQLSKKGILAVNLLSSPGAGKTMLLEKLSEVLKPDYKMAVIEGDIETERDAERIRAKGIPAWQIMTGGACHLEAKMIGRLFPDIPKKYPKAFITSDSLIISKSDLVSVLPFDIEGASKEALEMNPRMEIFVTSSLNGDGIKELSDYFIQALHKLRSDHA